MYKCKHLQAVVSILTRTIMVKDFTVHTVQIYYIWKLFQIRVPSMLRSFKARTQNLQLAYNSYLSIKLCKALNNSDLGSWGKPSSQHPWHDSEKYIREVNLLFLLAVKTDQDLKRILRTHTIQVFLQSV